MSALKDAQLWDTIKDKPVKERVFLVLQTYGKMYEQADNPFRIIAESINDVVNNISTSLFEDLEKKQGKDFVISVIETVKDHFEDFTITEGIDSVINELKQ